MVKLDHGSFFLGHAAPKSGKLIKNKENTMGRDKTK